MGKNGSLRSCRIPLSLPWVPERNGSRFLGIAFQLPGLRPVDFRNEGRLLSVEERFDSGQRPDEVLGQGRKGRFADDDQQGDAKALDCHQLGGRVADALVVGYRDPIPGAAVFQPLLVRAIRRKEIVMPFDRQSGGGENFGEAFTQVAVCEV